jgi:Tol biopolymer transport system component
VLTSPYGEFDARLSPNDKWLAYTSDETERVELYVTSFPAAGSKWQVSNSGITSNDVLNVMDWSPDGKSLRYQAYKIYDVELQDNGGKPDFSAPKEIAGVPPGTVVISILPDNKRILVPRPVGDNAASPFELLLNWQELFR